MSVVGVLLRLAAGTVALGAVALGSLLYTQQRALIYCASLPEDSRIVVETPDLYDMPYTEQTLETPDGERLRSYVMRQPKAGERPTIIMFHANAGNMGHRLPIAAVFFRRLGCNVAMLSYRGYGLSSGTPSESGLRIDAQAMLDFVRADEALARTKVLLYGQSIGGAVAIDLAARRPAHVDGLIVENTFLSLPLLVPHLLPGAAPFTFLLRTSPGTPVPLLTHRRYMAVRAPDRTHERVDARALPLGRPRRARAAGPHAGTVPEVPEHEQGVALVPGRYTQCVLADRRHMRAAKVL